MLAYSPLVQSAEPDLWHNREFLKMWIGGTISGIGSQVTTLAVPLIAVLLFNAGPSDTGLLTAVSIAPFILFGLPAGAWIDRLPRRPVRIAADSVSAIAVLSVPAASALGSLSIELLYVVTFIVGTASVFGRLAHGALLPSIVGKRHLLDANGAVLGSFAVAQIAGPSLAGVMMQFLQPPQVLLLDAFSFLFCVACYATLHEPRSTSDAGPRAGIVSEIVEGLVWLRGDQVLLRLTIAIGLANLSWYGALAVVVPFATRDLDLPPALLGLALATMGPASLIGATVAARMSRAFGLGPTLVASLSGELLSRIVLVLAAGPQLVAASILGASQLIFGFIAPLWDVNASALLQSTTPARLLGRVSAARNLVGVGAAPIGALAAGFIGEVAGARTALALSAAVTVIAVGCLLVPAVLRLKAPSTDE